jgi:hypothetical protein
VLDFKWRGRRDSNPRPLPRQIVFSATYILNGGCQSL